MTGPTVAGAPFFLAVKKWAAVVARVLLGLVFVAAGLGKVFEGADPRKMLFNPFPDFLQSAFNAAIFSWLPRIELVIGLLLLIGIAAKIMAVIAGCMATAFAINNAWLLGLGLGYEPCSCFGVLDRWLKAELSTQGSLIFDIVMLGLVLVVLFWGNGGLFTIPPWLSRKTHG